MAENSTPLEDSDKEFSKTAVTAEGTTSFLIRLPKGALPNDVTGLHIEMQTGKVTDAEAFTLVFRTAPGKSRNKAAAIIDQMSLFKPPVNGEKIIADLGRPPSDAWTKDADTWFLKVTPQVVAGHPQRRVPVVELSVVAATASFGK